MLRRLERVLDLRPGELTRGVLLFAYLFFVIGSFTVSDPDGLDDLDAIQVNGSTFTVAQLSAASDTIRSPQISA